MADTLLIINSFASLRHCAYLLQDKPKTKPRKICKRASKPSKAKATKLELCTLYYCLSNNVPRLTTFVVALQTGHMLANVSTTAIAGRELGAMSSEMKSNLVASLDKTLNTSVNKVRQYNLELH